MWRVEYVTRRVEFVTMQEQLWLLLVLEPVLECRWILGIIVFDGTSRVPDGVHVDHCWSGRSVVVIQY